MVINGSAEAMDGPGTKQEESHKGEVWEEAWLPFSGGQGSIAMEEHVITHIHTHTVVATSTTQSNTQSKARTFPITSMQSVTQGESLFFQLPPTPAPQHWAAEDP